MGQKCHDERNRNECQNVGDQAHARILRAVTTACLHEDDRVETDRHGCDEQRDDHELTGNIDEETEEQQSADKDDRDDHKAYDADKIGTQRGEDLLE